MAAKDKYVYEFNIVSKAKVKSLTNKFKTTSVFNAVKNANDLVEKYADIYASDMKEAEKKVYERYPRSEYFVSYRYKYDNSNYTGK